MVILVGPNSAQAAMAPGEEHACRAGVRLERCPDVYRALARILATPKTELVAVVVALECVGPRELAFFTNTSRLRPGLAVLVHGHGANDPCVSRAIESGATGIFTAGFWNTFVPQKQVVASVAVAPVVPANPGTPVNPIEALPVDDSVEPTELAEDVEEDPESHDAPVSPRVPWLRYSDAPARSAPAVRTPPPPTPVPPPVTPLPPGDADYEPLLTDEELEALMADDISTIVPKTDPSWRRNDGLGGRS